MGYTKWSDLPEETVCSRALYGRLTHFILHVYRSPGGTQNKGAPLKGDTPLIYVNATLSEAANTFKAIGTPATRLFFSCQVPHSTSDDALWLRRLRANIKRVIFE